MRSVRLILLSPLLVVGIASAHVPQVGESDHVIDEADRSWAFYEELPADGVHTWTFSLSAGDPLFVSIAVPTGAAWTPDASLQGPLGPIPLQRETTIALEPFATYASREVWSIDTTAATTGSYRLTVSGEGGRYVLGYGLAEHFTLAEWIGIPIETAKLRAWQGQPLWKILLPYVTGMFLVAALAMRVGSAPLLSRLASGLFLGSALDRMLQIVLAAQAHASAPPGAWILAGSLAVPALALAWTSWRARRAWVLALTGLAGFAMWAGLLVAPAIVLIAAAIRVTNGAARRERAPPRA